MAITGIKKRVACFYDDRGEYLGMTGFSKTDQTFEFSNRSFNVKHNEATFTLIKRWYWNIEIYYYNINNPDPIKLDKRCEPIMDSEMYNIQLNTKVARDLNDLNKGIKLDLKTILIAGAVIIVLILFLTGKIKL